MAERNRPPMDPNTSEATAQLDFAREQGEAYGRTLEAAAKRRK